MTTWIATTQDDKLADRTSDIESTNATTAADLQLDGNEYQALRGFGGCFNELGWLPLQNVSEAERDQIIKELFSPDEMNFTFNRAPVGANDFADHWYSYDEVDGDYGMEHFSVEHDEQTLIPYIHRAQEWQPNMQLFSSPWSPPTWMKRPKAYNYGRLVQTPENLKAYAKYFVKYIQAYAEHGITVNQLQRALLEFQQSVYLVCHLNILFFRGIKILHTNTVCNHFTRMMFCFIICCPICLTFCLIFF